MFILEPLSISPDDLGTGRCFCRRDTITAMVYRTSPLAVRRIARVVSGPDDELGVSVAPVPAAESLAAETSVRSSTGWNPDSIASLGVGSGSVVVLVGSVAAQPTPLGNSP